MDEMLEDVEKIARQLYAVLGKDFYNLFDHNEIFALVEERGSEPSEVRVANIMNSIMENYADVADIAVGFNNNIEVAACRPTSVESGSEAEILSASASPVSNTEIKAVDHHSLVQHLSSMFPETPIDYIWDEAKDLVGKEVAIERFTRQLLENHLPPEHWAVKGFLLECECCFSDTEEKYLVQCPAGHTFCHQCIKTGASVALGDGKTGVQCMTECREEINWRELEKALEPGVLIKLEQRRQAEEVTAAGLERLVSCPFCPYQTIMEDPSDRVLVCRNPECGKDSCRHCKKGSHIPLRCDELPEVEGARKKIEEELSLAMLRQCRQCKKMFYKEEGCNHMTCTCGAQMCYLCKAQVSSYDHFYGQGGEPTTEKVCPLYSDIQALHRKEVTAAAVKAKEELALSNDLARVLKVDVEQGNVVVDQRELL